MITTDQILKKLDIEQLKPMQVASIKAFQTKKDVVLLSPTGSGKTLGFLLPLLGKLNPNEDRVQAMIIAPSRELALQIEQVFKKMGTGFKVNCCYGGHAMRIEKNNLSVPPALIIGTPGRLADHIRRENFDPSAIRTLVMDEFDKALEFGFEKEMRGIIEAMPRLDQRILTSATQAIDIPEFTGIQNPVELNYIDTKKSFGLTLRSVRAEGKDKLDILFRLLCHNGEESALVFCNHRDAVERISELLHEYDLAHDIFHGGLKQEDRERALIKFRNGSLRVLITTDLASRGLDIPEINNVIHYQLPTQEAAYTHRNGRTARMHAEGTAWLVMSAEDEIPEYLQKAPKEFDLPMEAQLPPAPEWETIYIGGGKKDKISKGDVVGFLFKIGGLNKGELGIIEIQDHAAYAAVKREALRPLVRKLHGEQIKGRRFKVDVSQ